MTVQEAKAKEVLNNIWDFADAQDEEKGDVVDDAVIEAIGCMEEVEQYRALGIVEELKEAREKQIPKEPIPNCSFFKCPSCESFDIETFNDSGGSTKNKFCPDCGKALKWGEED